MKHANIALFVPHAGCKHSCSFCNQRTISGQTKPLTPDDVRDTLLSIKPEDIGGENAQLAFFGGSFTAIDREYMISLLEAANEFADKGIFGSIRISTRPDAVEADILKILKKYNVKAIELGAQSTDEEVLILNERGHGAQDIFDASRRIKEFGFSLGLQMMTGLLGDTNEKALNTCEDIISMQPETVRIYPTIVLEGTRLAQLYKKGEYSPQSLEDSVLLTAKLLGRFLDTGIKVIRMGLHSGGNVTDGYVAGPFHPAFGELCESRLYFNRALELLKEVDCSERLILAVNNREISKMTGQKRENLAKLEKMGYNCKVKGVDGMPVYEIKLYKLNGETVCT